MTQRKSAGFKRFLVHYTLRALLILLPILTFSGYLKAEPSSAAVSAFNSYVSAVESRLAQQHRSHDAFLSHVPFGQQRTNLQSGELIIDQITPSAGADIPGALLHHWRGTAFAPGAKGADFVHLMRDFNNYPQHFSPQVIQAKILTQHDNYLQAAMRVRQQNVITVVMDSTYDIAFGQLDAQHGYSISRSTHIAEIDQPGTKTEHALNAKDEHGFLWRQNTYWSFEERDGGLYIQIESVSLTRSIPTGMGWVLRPFIESVPRKSLEFTLRSTRNALFR
jgi:hypothetical protein